jgi:putative membrane protein
MLAVDSWSHRRRLWVSLVASVAVVFLAPGVARAEPTPPVPPNGLLSDTAKGTVTAADIDFVTRVRLAGLWEIPAGQMAQQKSANPRIQEIGRTISAQHVALDELDRAAAKKLDIDLPGKPNADQQKWLGEMRDAEGEEFDQIYIDRLRAAHGKIFPAIATIRASTRNDTVRKLAQQANQFVMTHMTLLESSGIVDFQGLPTVPPPSASAAPVLAADRRTTAPVTSTPITSTPVVLLALAGGILAGILGTRFLIGRRPRRYYRR